MPPESVCVVGVSFTLLPPFQSRLGQATEPWLGSNSPVTGTN